MSSRRMRDRVSVSAPEAGIRGLVMSLNPSTAQRGGQSKIHPWTIRHDSLFKAIWDWLILLLVFYTAIEIPYTVAFTLSHQIKKGRTSSWSMTEVTPLHICNLWVDLMFIVDILINFRTTFIASSVDEIISQPKKIALHYLKTWFIVDFFAAIPFDIMVNPSIEGVRKNAATLIGLSKTARLLRLVRVARKLDRYSEYGLAVVILLTCLFTLCAHWLACIWHVIGNEELKNQKGWIWSLSNDHGMNYNTSNPASGPPLDDRYITALYFTLTSLTTVGFGNISPNTNAEKSFSICVMIVGALMYASIFGNLTAIIQRLYSRTSRFHKDLRVIEEFSKFHKIPNGLQEDLEEYFRHEWSYTKGVDIENVLRRFPECLRADVCHHLHKKLFNECSAFESAEEGCLRALSIRFFIRHFLPGHFLIKQGDEVTNLYFIVKGSMEVVKDGMTVLTLGKGDTISCDYGSLHSTYLPKANASLLIQSHTEIHYIPWNDLLVVLKAYPKFSEKFLNELELAYNLGETEENDEFFLTENPAKPRARRLSNARSTLQTSSRKESMDDNSVYNGRIPGLESETEVPASKNFEINEDTDLARLVSKSKRRESETQAEQMKRLEKKLDNIDERLLCMEKRFNDTLEQLMELLKTDEESATDDKRKTVGKIRTTSV